jgi:hypothetical protein
MQTLTGTASTIFSGACTTGSVVVPSDSAADVMVKINSGPWQTIPKPVTGHYYVAFSVGYNELTTVQAKAATGNEATVDFIQQVWLTGSAASVAR